MTAVTGTAARSPRTTRGPALAAGRLLLLELRHNAMSWMVPVVIALFWLTAYRKIMAMPPLWYPRATSTQSGAVLTFVSPVVGAAVWMGSRERRRHATDLVTITALSRWARLITTWAATTCWAAAAYLACLALVYWPTARQAGWGGPLWWPAAVAAASLPAFSALGFAAGIVLPSRFTAPVAAIASFFVLALSTQPITGSQSYWQVMPLVSAPWDTGPDAGVATFYPYAPDLAIAQVMFLIGLTMAVLAALALPRGSGGRWPRRLAAVAATAGVLAAGTGVALAGTGRLGDHGMITIPALHDAVSDRPARFTPVCSAGPGRHSASRGIWAGRGIWPRTPRGQSAVPVCLNPAYASYLAATVTGLEPVLTEIAGLPGAPVRIIQAAARYQQGPGNSVGIALDGPLVSGRPPVFRLLLPDQLLGPVMTVSETAIEVRSVAGPELVAAVIGNGPGASRAQQAVGAALLMAAGLPPQGPPSGVLYSLADRVPGARHMPCRPSAARCRTSRPARVAGVVSQPPWPALSSVVLAAARRFATLPLPVRRGWLAAHLAALRAGQVTLVQLP